MQFMRIMKVIMTYDYWIYRPSLALNPYKRYQIIYASAHSCSCTCMQKWICMKCPHTSHVECGQFLNSQHAWVCWDMVARMRSTLMLRLRVVPHFLSGKRAWKSPHGRKGDTRVAFSRVGWFSRSLAFRVSLALLSLRKSGGLLVVYLMGARSYLRPLLPSACYAGCMVARAIVFEIPRLTVKCPVSLTRWWDNLSR